VTLSNPRSWYPNGSKPNK